MFRGVHGIKRTDLSFEAICSSAWLHPSIKHSEEQSLGGTGGGVMQGHPGALSSPLFARVVYWIPLQ